MGKLYKKGDRVKLLSKSIYCLLEESRIYNENKELGIWYFIRYLSDKEKLFRFHREKNKNICTVGVSKERISGDYFLESDLIKYCGDFLSEDDFQL